MARSIVMKSSLIAWGLAILYYKILSATGLEISAILYAAIIVISVGLYLGFRENRNQPEEES